MFTVVTGFFDIGRSEWDDIYKRSTNDYLKYFKNMLSLKVNMFIFIELVHFDFVKNIRDSIPCKTTIVVMKQSELYMYQYLDKIKQIQYSNDYAVGHPNKKAPEICHPLYNVVTCSKMDLISKAAIIENECEYFIWMDAGYTHNTVDFTNLNWNPTQLFQHKDKICFIALQSLDVVKNDPKDFFLQYIDVIIGGFFGGYKNTILQVRNLYYNLVLEMFDIGIKDDDQFYNTILVKRYPELFKIYIANWYDAILFT
jgi:protein YibB